MRVLLVANTLPPRDISGVGEQVLQLASGLRTRGHDVEVLGRGADGAPGPKILFPLLVVPVFLRRLFEFRPHVVQVHESDGVLAGLLTQVVGAVLTPRPLLVALLQVSYVREIRAVRPIRSKGEILGTPGATELRFRYVKAPFQVVFGALTAWLADLVLAPSRVTAEEVGHDYSVDEVGVVPNVTGGLLRESAAAAASAGGTEEVGKQYLLFVGRLRIRKGVEVLLDAARILLGEGREFDLLIVGDGEQRTALEECVDAAGLGQQVTFLGRRSPEEVRRLLVGSSALVVPSIYEGMPLVILEAMERSRAVVASAVSGIPEVVVEGETGWLVPAEDSDALANALREILTNPVEVERRGAAGKSRVRELFRPENAATLWEARVARLLRTSDIE